MRKVNTRSIILCGLFAALIAVGAFIKIPFGIAPFTFQVLFVVLAGFLLGSKRALISVLVYIAIGLSGIPVFAAGGGINYVLHPTFGYLIGFALAAFIIGYITERMKELAIMKMLLVSFLGVLSAYTVGLVYFYVISNYLISNPIGVKTLLWSCFVVFIPGDIIKCIVGVLLSKRLNKALDFLPVHLVRRGQSS